MSILRDKWKRSKWDLHRNGSSRTWTRTFVRYGESHGVITDPFWSVSGTTNKRRYCGARAGTLLVMQVSWSPQPEGGWQVDVQLIEADHGLYARNDAERNPLDIREYQIYERTNFRKAFSPFTYSPGGQTNDS